jgi:hypothetical protein
MILVNSKEWNGWIHQNNQHLKEDELTENNIRHETDLVGDCWGRQVWKSLLKDKEWLFIAMGQRIVQDVCTLRVVGSCHCKKGGGKMGTA